MRSALHAVAWFSAGVLGFLAVLEALLRVLPSMSGLNPSSMQDRAPLYNYEAHRPYRYSQTWAMLNPHRGTTNNYGHIAPYDFRAGSRPVIVVGDSYVESLMNDYRDTIQALLGSRLGSGLPVYGLGASGLSVSDYVVLARQARDEFAPRAAVFLIIDGDISESLLPRPGGYVLERHDAQFRLRYVPRSPSALVSWVRTHLGESALYSYLRGNLKFSPGDLVAGLGAGKPKEAAVPRHEPDRSHEQRSVVDWFLDEIALSSGVPPACTVLLQDSDRYAIYDTRLASVPKDAPETRRYLAQRGRALGFQVIDLHPVFEAEYLKSGLKLDHWPLDRHWSRHGHAVAADAVASNLLSDPAARACLTGTGAPEQGAAR